MGNPDQGRFRIHEPQAAPDVLLNSRPVGADVVVMTRGTVRSVLKKLSGIREKNMWTADFKLHAVIDSQPDDPAVVELNSIIARFVVNGFG